MREIPPLPDSAILLVEVGSTAHGTGIPDGEDHDEMAVVIESPRQVLGLGEGLRTVMQRTQPEGTRSGPGDTDRTLYSLRKFLRLAASGNPSIILGLWAPVIKATEQGRSLQGLGEAFVGRHVIPRYRGYMQSQAMRLLGVRGGGHGRRGGGGREELISAHGYDTKYAMHTARLGFQCIELLTYGHLMLPIPEPQGSWLRAVREGHVPFEEWWKRCLLLDQNLANLQEDKNIPDGPQRKAIEEWSINAHQQAWEAD